MPFRQAGSLRSFHFETLDHPVLEQAIFTRQGGVSPAPWETLNLGGTVGDDRQRVLENKRRVLDAVGRSAESLHEVWQVHSADVVHASQPRGSTPLRQADALITDNPGVTLLMRFADCVPIYLFDPRRSAIAMVHAGWLGTVRKTVVNAVRALRDTFGSHPEDLLAGIGPSIGPDHYPVGDEVIGAIRAAFGSGSEELLTPVNGSLHLDLWLANRRLLESAGVGAVETAGLCTACHLEDWFSHRGERGATGRFGGLLALKA